MRASDIITTRALSLTHAEAGSNKVDYLGVAFFPNTRKMGIDLKQILTAKGLPVTLNPSAYDTNSTIRSREGFKINNAEMAFFKESMLVKEQDKIELMRAQDANDPFVKEVYANVFNDFETLYESADVVAERMRMQLLSSDGGHPSISLSGDGATYEYNYDPNNEYSTSNYEELSGTNVWSDTTNADPIADLKRWKKAVIAKSGSTPKYALMNSATFDQMCQCAKFKAYAASQLSTITGVIDDEIAIDFVAKKTGLTILVYDKMFNNAGAATTFYPEGFVALLPEGTLGKTYYGSTPDEVEMLNGAEIDTAVIDNKVTVTVMHTVDPAQDKTTVSEVLLPSFERMFETFTAKAYTPA